MFGSRLIVVTSELVNCADSAFLIQFMYSELVVTVNRSFDIAAWHMCTRACGVEVWHFDFYDSVRRCSILLSLYFYFRVFFFPVQSAI